MSTHKTVLEAEAVDALNIELGAVVVDATLGSGGHSLNILSKIGKEGTLVALDADEAAVLAAPTALRAPNVQLLTRNFKDIDVALTELGITKVDGILADLGWRTDQMGGNGKGFSFQIDEPLIMTYGDPSQYPCTAGDIVNDWDEIDIHNVLKGYGEERYARRIAKAIVEAREKKTIESSQELREIVVANVPAFYRKGKIHPATRTFQALRIAVNDELSTLETFLEKSMTLLKPSGRLAVITFHSLEDRIVKHMFREATKEEEGTVVTKKPIVPKKEEVEKNPRARSAKLRIFQKNDSA